MPVRILDSVVDPGPCPPIPADEQPEDRREALKWEKGMREYGRWLDLSRRYALAQKVKQLEAIPTEKRTLEQDILYLLAMDVLANDLHGDSDVLGSLFR